MGGEVIRVLEGEEAKSIAPILKQHGFSLTEHSVVFAEYSDSGKLLCVLPLQQMLFAEGVVSLDKHSNIRSLWSRMEQYLAEKLGDLKGKSLLAIPSSDKVASACEALGCVSTGQTVYRRDF